MADQVEIASVSETREQTAPANSALPTPLDHPHKSSTAPGLRLLIIGTVLLLAAGGIFLWRHLTAYESTDDAQVDAHIHPISARVSGYVIDVPVNDNQYVQKGAVLVSIDPRDYQVAVDKARADLADAQAKAREAGINVPLTSVNTSSSLQTAQAGVENAADEIKTEEEQASAADETLKEAQANDVKAQNDLERYGQLVSRQEISQQQYDQAVAAARASTANVAQARASADAAHEKIAGAREKLVQAQASRTEAQTGPQQVATRRSEAEAAMAEVQQKQSALEQAELNLQYTTITAPVNGIVYRKVEVGQNIQPGQELVSVVPVDDVYVTANFKETQLEHMRVGQRAVIHVDAYGRDYNGRVESIAGASGDSFSLLPPENATGNYVKVVQRVPVKIALDPGQNDDHLLRVGMSVEPRVYVK
jgi:membrane fusion protein (multidrug efflux system)